MPRARSPSTDLEPSEEILYEMSFPYLREEESPNYNELFKCTLPHSITKEFFQSKFQTFPFIQQTVFVRALPNTDFPPLPTVYLSDITLTKHGLKQHLPVSQRQLSANECDIMKSHQNATHQLMSYLDEYWLTFEPYVPKWPVHDEKGVKVPDDEKLPPHASSFRANFDAQIIHTATFKKNQILNRHTYKQGIDYSQYMVGINVLKVLGSDYHHLLDFVAGKAPGQEIHDQRTNQIVFTLNQAAIKIQQFLRKCRKTMEFSEITVESIVAFVKSEVVSQTQQLLSKIDRSIQLTLQQLSEDDILIINEQFKECARLESLIDNLKIEEFELLEGEYLYNEEQRHTVQIEGQRDQLIEEMELNNETYNLIGQAVKVPKTKVNISDMNENQIKRYKQRSGINLEKDPDIDTKRRFAPHKQSLPPPDSTEFFYNRANIKQDFEATPIVQPVVNITRELVTPGERTRVIVSNRELIPEFIYDGIKQNPLLNRPSIILPQSCFFRSGSHGHGLFSLSQIPSQTVFCEYAGELIGTLLTEIRDLEYQKNGFTSVYMFDVRRDQIIDATFMGNYGRFINHCCDPNSESSLLFKEGNGLGIKFKTHSDGVGVVLKSIKGLQVGQESFQNYNMSKAKYDQKIPCYCGSNVCSGFMN
ncbi:Histone-lysine_N-methyltransferase SETD1 [Hexamita inflata]|uniref:Histone-lysine N-methyltransferase SETD1 n=1 Tax=Hexamita inflata TaxID=28002 RepID=A0AA86QAV3_9EUKA|nr:Histone-lysine N-methyltransferase SETD1 [Hexamita inflata]